MAQKKAQVVLVAKSDDALREMRKFGDKTKQASDKGKKALKGVGQQLDKVERKGKEAKQAMGGMGTAMGGLAKGAGVLAGAFAGLAISQKLTQGVKSALDFRSQMRLIGNELERAGAKGVNIDDLSAQMETLGAETGAGREKFAAAFQEIRNTTQDLDFAREVIDSLGDAYLATGKDVESLGAATSQLNKRFGLTAKEAPEALAQVVQAADKGAFAIEEFGTVADRMGPLLKVAGLEGKEALGALITVFDDSTKTLGGTMEKMAGLEAALQKLGDGKRAKKIAKELKIDPEELLNEKNVLARLERILAEGQAGLDTLSLEFKSGKEKGALENLIRPFKEAHTASLKETADTGQAVAAGLSALRGARASFQENVEGLTAVQRQADEALNDANVSFDQAMEEFKKSLSDPAITKALGQLAKVLPVVAKAFTKLVGAFVDDPSQLFGGGATGRLAASAAGNALGMSDKSFTDTLSEEASRLTTGKGLADAALRIAGAGGLPSTTFGQATAKDEQRVTSAGFRATQAVFSGSAGERRDALQNAKAALNAGTEAGVDERKLNDLKKTMDQLRQQINQSEVQERTARSEQKAQAAVESGGSSSAASPRKVAIDQPDSIGNATAAALAKREIRVRVMNAGDFGGGSGDSNSRGTPGLPPPRSSSGIAR